MNDLIINPKTRNRLEVARKSTAHSYLFLGKEGLGKTLSAVEFARNIMGEKATEGDNKRWMMFVEPIEGKKLSIEQMRAVRAYCNKTANSDIENKSVIIDEADNMSLEAYNSLLTLLEEPPAKTVIILVAHSKVGIPKTILSRIQVVNFYPPNASQISELVEKSGLPEDIVNSVGMLPAKLTSYSERISDLVEVHRNAKNFIAGGLIERLMIISTLKDKKDTGELMAFMAAILQSQPNIEGWSGKSEGLILAQAHLYNNGNAKLVMENLAQEF